MVEWLAALVRRMFPVAVRRKLNARVLAGVVTAVTVLVGISIGTHVVGGSDSYGYVSQAHLWATGELTVPQPLLNDLPPGVPQEALVPLAYRLSPDRSALVPVYAPGLPLMMAAFERIGGRDAVYMVVPILGGLAVWATFAIGRSLIGELGGSLAALLLATSPAFVFQLISAPMSDIAAAAWWNASLFLAWRSGRTAALASGLATAAAILTRPNLVPLAVIPGGVVLIGLLSRNERSFAAQRLLCFAAPSVVACVAVAYLNSYWYGSPLASGYGALAGELFRWEYFWPNVFNYSKSILDTQGPLALLGVVGLLALCLGHRLRRERNTALVYLCFAIAVYACYAFYLPIEIWWSLRFLFPAFPMFFVLLVAGGLALADRMPHNWRTVGLTLLVSAITIHAMTFSRSVFGFTMAADSRYEIVGRYVNEHMSPRAAFFTMLHSGSVRHYSGRLTVRYDRLLPEQFETMVMHLQHRGYTPFLLLDDGEEANFKHRFDGTSVVKSLNNPQVSLGSPHIRQPRVTLYPLSADNTDASGVAKQETRSPEQQERKKREVIRS